MKTFTKSIWVVFLALLAIPVMTSCSDDDEDEKISVGTPKYEAISGKYTVENSTSPYESIELGASGSYIITERNGYQRSQTKQIASSTKKGGFLRSPQSDVLSRGTGYNGLIYGTYSQLEDGTLKLDGFGILEIIYGTDNQEVIGFNLTPTGQSKVQLDVTKEEMMKDDELTNALCRTWKIESIRSIVYFNGKKVYDETATAENPGEEYEDDDSFPKEVLFSKAGTYMVYYENQTIGISSWKWKSQKEHTFYYAWENDWDEEAFATVSFSGNRLTVSTAYGYDEEEGAYKEETYTILTEK